MAMHTSSCKSLGRKNVILSFIRHKSACELSASRRLISHSEKKILDNISGSFWITILQTLKYPRHFFPYSSKTEQKPLYSKTGMHPSNYLPKQWSGNFPNRSNI